VAATTTTTIRGVSLFNGQRPRGDAFDLVLSLHGIEIRRPGHAVQRMSWSRVSQWEIEERRDYCLLTLRGDGATTPLVVPGWTLDDLEILMRELTAGEVTAGSPGAADASPGATEESSSTAPAPAESRADRRRRQRLQSLLSWKAVTAVVLLGLLAAAVALVLLQSAGVIDWGFLGPTA
jgi:hypothetical protein